MSITSAKRVWFAWSLAGVFGAAALGAAVSPAFAQNVEAESTDASPDVALEDATVADDVNVAQQAPMAARGQDGDIAQQARMLLGVVDAIQLPAISETPALQSGVSLTDAVAHARTRFQLKEWLHSAAILAGVVPELRANNSAMYGDASYMLAESLYQAGAYALAQEAFQQIINDRASSYAKTAQMRLLSIAMILRDNKAVDREYDTLLRAYGDGSDGAVFYLLARTKYYRERFASAAEQFARVPTDSAYYWRAQYYRGVALAHDGTYDEAIASFERIEQSLSRSTELTDREDRVLQLSRVGQGAVYYEKQEWASAVDAYSRVDSASSVFEEALYQRAWSEIRLDDVVSAIHDLELLTLVSSNTRNVANARLLAADLQRKAKNYDAALDAFSVSADDLRLMRRQLLDIQKDKDSVLARLEESKTILTGTILAQFDPYDWFPDDPIGRKGLEILKASSLLGEWVDTNQRTVDELSKALSSGYAYDSLNAARQTRGQLVEAQRDAARLRAQLVERVRPEVRADNQDRLPVDASADYLAQLPQQDGAHEQHLEASRAQVDRALTRVYQEQQDALAALENIQAEDNHVREAMRLRTMDADVAYEQRKEIRARMERQQRIVNQLQDQVSLWAYRRARFGVGESQSVLLDASRALDDAAAAELVARAQDQAEANALLAELRRRIDEKLGELDDRVAQAWMNAYQIVRREESDVAHQISAQERSQKTEIRSALDAAAKEFTAVVENVGDAALRANLGEIDVAWWQKEDVSHYIDSLFRERERQIKRLDNDFWELRD